MVSTTSPSGTSWWRTIDWLHPVSNRDIVITPFTQTSTVRFRESLPLGVGGSHPRLSVETVHLWAVLPEVPWQLAREAFCPRQVCRSLASSERVHWGPS